MYFDWQLINIYSKYILNFSNQKETELSMSDNNEKKPHICPQSTPLLFLQNKKKPRQCIFPQSA